MNIPNVYVSEFAVSEDKHTTEKRLSNNCESPSPIITPTYSPQLTPTPTSTPPVCFKMVFDATGHDQYLVVPDNVTQLTAEVWGAGGSDGCFKNSTEFWWFCDGNI